MKFSAAFLTGGVARRVFLLFAISAFLPMAVLAVLSYVQTRQMLMHQGEQRLAAAAKSYGTTIFERLLLAIDLAASVEGRDRASIPGDSMVRRNFRSFAIFGPDGRLVERYFGADLPAPDAQARARLANGKAVVLASQSDGAAQVVLFAPLHNPGRGFIGVQLDPLFLWGEPELLPAATDFCVVADDTKVLLHCSAPMPDTVLRTIELPVTQSSLQTLQWEKAGEPYRAVTWGQFLRAAFGTADWIVIASQPESLHMSRAVEYRQLFIPAVGLALLLATWFTVRQARSIVVPVGLLAAQARRIAQNQFAGRLGLKSKDEFGELARAFDNMSARLGRQFETLTALSEVDRLILNATDTDEVIRAVLERLGDIVPAQTACVTLFDHNNREFASTYFRALHSRDKMVVVRHAIDPAQMVAFQGQSEGSWIALDDSTPEFLEPLHDRGARTAYVQPIVWRDTLCGAMALGYSSDADTDEEGRQQVREFSDRVAVAVSSAWRDEQLFHQAHFDALSGLPNRMLFRDRLMQEIIRCRREEGRLAVLFIDIDHFKKINDTFGHTSGDEVIREAARRVAECIRASDTLARQGGDEFTVLLVDIHRPEDAGRVADTIVQALSREFMVAGQRSFLSASIGIAAYPENGASADEMLKNADTAMYRAKAGGRAQAVYFEDRMNVDAVSRITLDRDLRNAAERGELVVKYQPVVDLRTRHVLGAEALLRWQHPELGMIPPSRFIPIAEESGFIEVLGQWVLREVCAQMKRWRDEGLSPVRVAVNVSPRQFRNRGLVKSIRNCVSDAGLEPGHLELEITEGLLIDTSMAVDDMLSELQSMGVGLALDDFGTGFSSLAYLNRFPIQKIKIDRVFIERLGRGSDSGAIVAAIIAMSHALGKSVVAEGVETEEQLAILGDLRCDSVQGYLFSRALGAEEYADCLRGRHGVAQLPLAGALPR